MNSIARFFFITSAWAHAGHEHAPSPFVFKWAWDPTLLFFFVLAFFYFRGLWSFRGKSPVARWQVASFILGLLVLSAASLPPIDTVADQLFSIHMLQHLLITMVGIPLLTFGAPSFVSLKGFSGAVKSHILVPVLQRTNSLVRWLRRPLVAVFIYEFTFWIWHVPYLYNAALLNDLVHVCEHACMALAALNLWRLFIDPPPLKTYVALPVRLLLIGSMMTLDMALSAALTYSTRVWYAYDRLPQPSWWEWDRLRDQQFGGLIMWVPGSAVWVIALAATFIVFARQESRSA